MTDPAAIIRVILIVLSLLASVARYADERADAPPQTPSPTRTRPAEKESPRTASPPRRIVTGTATWYCSPISACTVGTRPGMLVAAAGEELQLRRWRDRIVTVRYGDRSVRVRLVDTCKCPGGRIIDLSAAAFSRLAPTSAGVIPVRVEW